MKTGRTFLALGLLIFCLFAGGISAHALRCEAVFQARRTPLTEAQIDQILAFRPRNLQRQPLTVGVEVEGAIPKSVSYRQLAQIIIEHVRAKFPEQRVRLDEEANEHAARIRSIIQNSLRQDIRDMALPQSIFMNWGPSGNGQHFVIKGDGTIRAKDEYIGVEFASPILRTPRDFQIFSSVIEHLIEQGIYKSHPTAGVHVHVGVPNAQTREVALLTRAFTAIQGPTYEHFHVNSGREVYAARFAEKYVRALTRASQVTRVMRFLNRFFPNRYSGLNLLNLGDDQRRTVEFRLFNSTDDIAELQSAIAFSATLVEQVRTQGPFVQWLLRETPTDSEAFEQLLLLSEDYLQRHFHPAEEVDGNVTSIAE